MIAPVIDPETIVEKKIAAAHKGCSVAIETLDSLAEPLSNVHRIESTKSVGNRIVDWNAKCEKEFSASPAGTRWLSEKFWPVVMKFYLDREGLLPSLPVRSSDLEEQQLAVAAKLTDESLGAVLSHSRETLIEEVRSKLIDSKIKEKLAYVCRTIETISEIEGTAATVKVKHLLLALQGAVLCCEDPSALGKSDEKGDLTFYLNIKAILRSVLDTLVEMREEHKAAKESEVKSVNGVSDSLTSVEIIEVSRPSIADTSRPGDTRDVPTASAEGVTASAVSFSPLTSEWMRLFLATLKPGTEEGASSPIVNQVRSLLTENLDPLLAKAILVDLAQVAEGDDNNVDIFRRYVKESLTRGFRSDVSRILQPLALPQELQTRVVDELVKANSPLTTVEQLAKSVPMRHAVGVFDLLLKLTETRGADFLATSLALLVPELFDSLLKVLQRWRYDDQEAGTICVGVLESLVGRNDEDGVRRDWKQNRSMVGSCIKKYEELHRVNPGPKDLNWSNIQREYKLLGELLKENNNIVRGLLRDAGVANSRIEGIVKLHWREARGLRVDETINRFQTVHTKLNIPLTHQSGAYLQLDKAEISWESIACMSDDEWKSYKDTLQSLWEFATTLDLTIFQSIAPADLASVENIAALKAREVLKNELVEAVGHPSVTIDTRKNRIKLALKQIGGFPQDEPLDSKLLNDCALIVAKLHETGSHISETTLHKALPDDTEGFQNALKRLLQHGIVTKPKRGQVNLSDDLPGILKAALNIKQVTSEQFKKRYLQSLIGPLVDITVGGGTGD